MSEDSVPITETADAQPSAEIEEIAETEETAETAPRRSFWKDYLQCLVEIIRNWGFVFFLLMGVYLIGYYTLYPSRGYFHSDSTDTLMWAVASHEGGSLFNPDFDYACLLPFGTSLIMQVLIPVFGVTMTTHVIGMFAFFLIFTLSLIWMLRRMEWSWNWISIAVFVELMICSASEKLREIFWGHSIYYSLGVVFIFVGLSLLFTCMDKFRACDSAADAAQKKGSRISLLLVILLLGVWFLLTCTDQIIAIAIFALPVMGALFCERWLDHGKGIINRQNLRALVLFVVMGIGMVLGYLVTAVAVKDKDIVAGYEGAFSNYSPIEEWADNLKGFPRAWFTLLGASMIGGDPLMSVKSVGNLLIVITGVILLITPVMALCCYKKLGNGKLRILVLTYWLMFMLIMMGYVMGRLSSANWRLSPIVAMSAVVTVAFLKWAVSQIEWQRIMTLLSIPVAVVCVMTAVTIAKMPADNTDRSHLYKLSAFLESQDLNYGYATFWNANGLTVVSDSAVKCRSVNIEENLCTPYTYQGCRSWYQNQPGQARYFLLMTEFEHSLLLDSELHAKKVGELESDGYFVWVFNDNLF